MTSIVHRVVAFVVIATLVIYFLPSQQATVLVTGMIVFELYGEYGRSRGWWDKEGNYRLGVDELDPHEGQGWDRIIGWRGFRRYLNRELNPFERFQLLGGLALGSTFLFFLIFGL